MIPAFMVSSAAATSSRHRVPLSMSVADIHGLAVGTTRGSHCLMASAALLLRGPDQLRKTLFASAIGSPAVFQIEMRQQQEKGFYTRPTRDHSLQDFC